MNRTYRVTIEETVADEFLVEAASEEEALEEAIQKYKTGKFILSPGEVVYRQLSIFDEGKETNWVKF